MDQIAWFDGFSVTSCQCVNYNPAYFGEGTRLSVLEPGYNITEPTVEIFPPSIKECKDKQKKKRKTLLCVASGFYPDHVHVTWSVDDKEVTEGVATDKYALRKQKHYQITSRLRVPAIQWHKANMKFICSVSFYNGNETINYTSKIYGDPKGQQGVLTRETFIKVTQTAKLTYCIFIAKNVVYGICIMILAWKLGLGQSHAAAKKQDS